MEPGQMTMGLPRLGRALKAVLLFIGVFGIVQAILVNYTPFGKEIFLALACVPDKVMHGEVWRLVTAGVLTSPETLGHLIFTLIGLYFLSPDLERRWGSGRFLRFLLTATVAGFALSILLDAIAPESVAVFHPRFMYGAGAAIFAVAVAWSKMNAELQVRLFFFLPVSGKQLFWLTIGFAVLGLVYPGSTPEGVASGFGGIFTGILLGGTPSVLRTLYLRAKLVFLRRGAAGASIQPLLKPPPGGGRRKGSGHPLRVVSGGLEDELKKRRPPKDKRYLN